MLLATHVREKAVLPGGHTVYAVTDSAWVMVPLQVRGLSWGIAAWVCSCCDSRAWVLARDPAVVLARDPAVASQMCSRLLQMCSRLLQATQHRNQPYALPLLQNEAADAAAAAALAGLPPPKADVDFWRALQQFTLNNAHYYCETADISRPFPRCACVDGWAQL